MSSVRPSPEASGSNAVQTADGGGCNGGNPVASRQLLVLSPGRGARGAVKLPALLIPYICQQGLALPTNHDREPLRDPRPLDLQKPRYIVSAVVS